MELEHWDVKMVPLSALLIELGQKKDQYAAKRPLNSPDQRFMRSEMKPQLCDIVVSLVMAEVQQPGRRRGVV